MPSESSPPRLKLDWRSACLFMVADPQWREKIWIGGWVLLIPVIGWPIILGYRKEAIVRLVSGQTPLLPPWNAGLGHFLKEGLKAMAVINTWFLPALIWVTYRLLTSPEASTIPWTLFLLLVLTLPIFSTLAVPALLLYGRFALTNPAFSWSESIAISLLFSTAVFLIPSGFLNVSRTGRYLAAFDLVWIVRNIGRHFWLYIEAWIGSGIISFVGHGCVPFSPWGVVWAYLAIVYFFNEIPHVNRLAPPGEYLDASHFAEFRTRYWNRFDVGRRGGVQHYVAAAAPCSPPILLVAGSFRALTLGPVSIPLP